MRIEDLTVALRPRTAWEAVELGTALARRHMGAVLRPWLAVSVPVLVLVNVLCWLIDSLLLAALVMWWLKPLFDRIPLYVLSRAVFGHVPGTWQTVGAQRKWGLGWMPGYLTWRRLSPLRSLNLPIDLLEGGSKQGAGARRSALGSPVYGVASLVTLVFLNFEAALLVATVSALLIFVPTDMVQETLSRMYNALIAQPAWLQLTLNGLAWMVTSFLEPFYVGAGFGLYLNRRTQIEGWDIEMALRRLRARLSQAAAPLLLLGVLGLALSPAARAQQGAPEREATMEEVFDDALVRDTGWEQAVKRAYEDPAVRPRHVVKQWVKRDQEQAPKPKKDVDLDWLGQLFALIGEFGLWVVLGVIVLALLITSPRWLGWLRESVSREGREQTPVQTSEAPPPQALPKDVPAEALRLWREGHERDALALMYRASVEDMARLVNVALVPGATEAHTLRASRRLPKAEDREVFARAVRTWQIAAYAHGLPSLPEFETLLSSLVRSFGWHTATGLGQAPAEASA